MFMLVTTFLLNTKARLLNMLKPTPHPKYPQYIIYPEGKVFSTKVNRFIKIGTHGAGYKRCFINSIAHSLHRLVAETFISNDQNKPCVNHLDGNKENNSVSNLEWCTHKENTHHMDKVLGKLQRGERCRFAKINKDEVLEIMKLLYENNTPQSEIAEKFGITQTSISRIKRGICWSHIKNIYCDKREHKSYVAKGEKNGFSKLKNTNVVEIKKLLKDSVMTQGQIGNMFGVKSGAISSIKVGRTWAHA